MAFVRSALPSTAAESRKTGRELAHSDVWIRPPPRAPSGPDDTSVPASEGTDAWQCTSEGDVPQTAEIPTRALRRAGRKVFLQHPGKGGSAEQEVAESGNRRCHFKLVIASHMLCRAGEQSSPRKTGARRGQRAAPGGPSSAPLAPQWA